MLQQLIQSPELSKYIVAFQKGWTIFMEEDDSQDLYILVSGRLEILKGNNKIMEIHEAGSFFGEISFLLGAKRTATVKALDTVKAIRIPKEEMTDFLRHFPEIAGEISRLLAQRLSATSQAFYGLKEFCDHLPDAVAVTDREGLIQTWNAAAERLYGRNWQSMHRTRAEDIYVEKEEYQDLVKEVQSEFTVTERILRVKHPEKGVRYVSTSTSALYDHQHHFQGIIALGRDVTALKQREQNLRRAFSWAVSICVVLLALTIGLFWGVPRFTRHFQFLDHQQKELKSRLAHDYLMLSTLLSDGLEQGQRSRTTNLLQKFFKTGEDVPPPYTGILLLDEEKKVFDAYFPDKAINLDQIIGSSYANLVFQGYEDSLHRVLTLYRADFQHPMGRKEIELAFRLRKENRFLGWLVFQMDQERLRKIFRMNENDLKKFRFTEP